MPISIAELRRDLSLPQPEPIEPGGAARERLAARARPAAEDRCRVATTTWCSSIAAPIMVGARRPSCDLLARSRAPSVVRRSHSAGRRLSAHDRRRTRSGSALALIDEAREQTQVGRRIDGHLGPRRVGAAHHQRQRRMRPRSCSPASKREHRDDPQVAAALYQLLYETGVIPTEAAHAHGSRMHEEAVPAVGGSRRPSRRGHIWTPDSDRPAGGKSALWTPSVDRRRAMSHRDTPRRTTTIRFMDRALALAMRGKGCVEPNPMVGCVIVRDGEIVGEGFHEQFGGPHAEVNALADGGRRERPARRRTSRSNPAAIRARRRPARRRSLRAGVKRVVVAVEDPFPQVSGRGIAELAGGRHRMRSRRRDAPRRIGCSRRIAS